MARRALRRLSSRASSGKRSAPACSAASSAGAGPVTRLDTDSRSASRCTRCSRKPAPSLASGQAFAASPPASRWGCRHGHRRSTSRNERNGGTTIPAPGNTPSTPLRDLGTAAGRRRAASTGNRPARPAPRRGQSARRRGSHQSPTALGPWPRAGRVFGRAPRVRAGARRARGAWRTPAPAWRPSCGVVPRSDATVITRRSSACASSSCRPAAPAPRSAMIADRLAQRPATRRRERLALVGADAANALVVLGEIDEAKIGREGAHQHGRLLERQALHQRAQLLAGRLLTRSQSLPQGAGALLERERLGLFLGTDHLAEQAAQQFDVVVQRARQCHRPALPITWMRRCNPDSDAARCTCATPGLCVEAVQDLVVASVDNRPLDRHVGVSSPAGWRERDRGSRSA